MDENQRQAVRVWVLERFGPDKYNRLVSAVPNTIEHGKLRYWQSEVFAEVREKTGWAIADVAEYARIFQQAPLAKKAITFKQFLAEPNRYYYLEPVELPDAWIAEAWERSAEFRDNVTYEYVREVNKNGDLQCLADSLRRLAAILPLNRMVEIYGAVRDDSPHREAEFRPTFERIFGSRMAAFPPSLTDPKA